MYSCSHCQAESTRWQGQCPRCRQWDTLRENSLEAKGFPIRSPGLTSSTPASKPVRVSQLNPTPAPRYLTFSRELNETLGGGLVPGSVCLLGGTPGAGKSTLLLQVAAHLSKTYRVLYVSGEESLNQVALHLQRLGLSEAEFSLLAETSVTRILQAVQETRPEILIVDSVQVLVVEGIQGTPGGLNQVKEAASLLVRLAKTRQLATLLVGHVTKEGALAGPKVLEHLVDASLLLEAPAHSRYRTLRTQKNRFGSVHELGIFAMTERGLREVPSPSAIFLRPNLDLVSGSAVASLWEGGRALLVEVQALADPHVRAQSPRALSLGLEHNRLFLLLAILNRHSPFQMHQSDIFLNVVGGLQITDTAIDLAVLASLASSFKGRPLPAKSCFLGEVGLGGELRPIPNGESRILTAQKHGFSKIFFPTANAIPKAQKHFSNLELIPLAHIDQLWDTLGY